MARFCRSASTLLALLFASIGPATADIRAPTLEYAVKAAYLYKFGAFIQWPDDVFASRSSPFNICIGGNDLVAEQLKKQRLTRQIGERPVVVREIHSPTADSNCQILYIGASVVSAEEWSKRPSGSPVLTVTDSSGSAGMSGMINFLIQDNSVRFEIDNDAAAQSRLLVSSKLLNLAVHSKTPSQGRPR